MAKAPAKKIEKSSSPWSESGYTTIGPEIEAETADRLQEARRHKIPFDVDMRESYFFAAPHRMRTILSTTKPTQWKPQDGGELNMSFAFETCGDFPTVMLNTFMPEAGPWALRKAPIGTPKPQAEAAEDQAADGTKTIFQAISASNFYSECGKAFNPDLAIGTVAMWIEDGRPGRPRRCQAVPIRELEISLDPQGCVDDRFVVRWTLARHIRRIFRKITLPPEVETLIADGKHERIPVVWGFWRVYDDKEEEAWQHVVTIDGHIVQATVIRGQGCCPLIVGRFNPGPEWSWGVGPLIQCLPEFRTLDEIAGAKVRNLDMSLDPPVSWPDDSFTNIEEGLESGKAYPVRPGTANDIKNIYTPNPPDAAIYDRQDLEQRIKRLFFLDWPQQRGDTPPTATQWLDEMTMAQRRIGTPGLPFWQEFCAGVFMRFEYLTLEAGEIKPVVVPGADKSPKTMIMAPYNPAQRAAEQQDVAQAARFLQIVAASWPEESKIAIDGVKSILAIRKVMGVEDLIVMRNKDDVDTAIKQMQALSQNPPGAPPAGAGAQPNAAPVGDLAGPAPAPLQTQIRGKL